MTTNHSLHGKAALVTGSSRGIGRAIAEALAGAGADVVVNYRVSRGAAEHVAACARALGVRALAPGPMLTDPTRPYAGDPAWVAMKTANLALGRMGTPEEVAQTAVFLCTDAAALYTGQSFNPNGGGAMV